ncbi:lipocalin [Pseudoponticoccus marisrubri]|uniref:Lipocalin n=1 Tax=Pseudoponticoccus marisrubri TaxID=1685382 RepID=A0A0W7WM83_9RHOB|nr:lipocalin [Pseudoponticoccus marisrubri]
MRALSLTLLAACASAPEAPSTVPTTIGLRNPTAPVASQADATLARLAGDWIVLQGGAVAPGTRLRIGPEGLRLNGVTLPLVDEGQGRFRLGETRLWVHWLDADNRTAALGDPDGGRVWIMDRTGRPGERLRAAREILDWYGYDLDRLVTA